MTPKSTADGALLPLTEEQELSYPSDQMRPRRERRAPSRPEVLYNLRVRDVMSANVVTVPESAALHEVTRRMRASHVSGLPVVDKGGRLAGIITETDVARVLGERTGASPLDILLHETPLPLAMQTDEVLNRYRETLSRVKVRDVMTPDPVSIAAGETLETAVRLMREERVNRLPVIEGGKLVGLIARQDLLAALLPA